MTRSLPLLAALLIAVPLGTAAHGDDLAAPGEVLVFADDFERAEADDAVEAVGGGWSTNSATRAQGHKQVDLDGGALRIVCHPAADHAVSVRHDAAFTDAAVSLRFMLPGEADSLKVNIADPSFKGVHAGHLCSVQVGPKGLLIEDLKTGKMNAEVRQRRKDGAATEADKQLLKDRQQRFPLALEAGRWYTLAVTIRGDALGVAVDGEAVGAFASPGIAHPTKHMIRLSVPREAVVDDVSVIAIQGG